jgi:hypothetical protein
MATTPTLSLGPSQVNSRDGGFVQTNSDIVALPDGGYLIVWEDRTFPGDTDMWGQRYDAAGAKVSDQFSVETVRDSQMVPALAVHPDGSVLVAFADDFADIDTWVDRFDANLSHLYDPDPASASHILRARLSRLLAFECGKAIHGDDTNALAGAEPSQYPGWGLRPDR